jgi:hypothetical protein
MARRISFDRDETNRIVRDLDTAYNNTQSDWHRWLSNLSRWAKMYRNIVEPKLYPWKGCSNLSLPTTTIGVEAAHSMRIGLLNQPNSLLQILPNSYADVDPAERVEKFINAEWFTTMDMQYWFDLVAHKTCMNGMQPLVLMWRRETQRIRECRLVPKSALPGRRKRMEDVAQFIFQDAYVSFNRSDGTASYREDGRVRTARIVQLRDDERVDPTDDDIEVEVERSIVTTDWPVPDVPAPEDLLPSADSVNPETASKHFYNIWMDFTSFMQKVDSGYYRLDPEVREALVKDYSQQGPIADETILGSGRRTTDELKSPVQTQSGMRRERLCVQKVFTRYDADHDGAEEECVFTLLRGCGGGPYLIRSDWLSSFCPNNRRPIHYDTYIYLDDHPAAIGVPELTATLKVEKDVLHNQMVDNGTIRNTPFGFYQKGFGNDNLTIRFKPGEMIPVSGQVWFPQIPGGMGTEMAANQIIESHLQQLIPVGPVVTGASSGGNRTAQGIAALIGQANSVHVKHLQRFARFIKSVGESTISLYAENMDQMREFMVTGTNEMVKLPREELRRKRRLQVMASALLSNKELNQAWAMLRYQLLANSPGNTPQSLYALKAGLLEAHDEPDAQRYLGPPPDEWIHPHISPELENDLFTRLIPHDPHADEDSAYHLEVHAAFAAQVNDPGVLGLVMEHMDRTKQIQSMQPNQQQQAMSQSFQQSPEGSQMAAGGPMGQSVSQMPDMGGQGQMFQAVMPQGMPQGGPGGF